MNHCNFWSDDSKECQVGNYISSMHSLLMEQIDKSVPWIALIEPPTTQALIRSGGSCQVQDYLHTILKSLLDIYSTLFSNCNTYYPYKIFAQKVRFTASVNFNFFKQIVCMIFFFLLEWLLLCFLFSNCMLIIGLPRFCK